MRKLAILIGVTALAMAGPALAYKLIAKGVAVVAGKAVTVTPGRDWTRIGFAHGKLAESWTLDGLTLNDVTFFGGVPDNTTLIKDQQKKEAPLPRFSKSMLAPDVAQLFEGTYRVALRTSQFSIDSVEPATFAGKTGFRFRYSFELINENVKRKGEAYGAINNGKLYLMTYEAPAIFYFDRNRADFAALVESARI